MTANDTLSLICEWCPVRSLIEQHHDFVPSVISDALVKRGIKWIEIPVPVGKFRIPVEDNAEFLLESYVELEALYNNDNKGTVKCILNDGELQFAWTKAESTLETSILIVPHLDGRFAERITMTMDSKYHMYAWRNIVAPLFD